MPLLIPKKVTNVHGAFHRRLRSSKHSTSHGKTNTNSTQKKKFSHNNGTSTPPPSPSSSPPSSDNFDYDDIEGYLNKSNRNVPSTKSPWILSLAFPHIVSSNTTWNGHASVWGSHRSICTLQKSVGSSTSYASSSMAIPSSSFSFPTEESDASVSPQTAYSNAPRSRTARIPERLPWERRDGLPFRAQDRYWRCIGRIT